MKAVREVLKTEKGQQILHLEAKVRHAAINGEYVTRTVTRETSTDPLGLSFVIPPRIMAVGWSSRSFLVLSGGPNLEKQQLKVGDIVVKCASHPVETIDDLQRATRGRTDMVFQVVRLPEMDEEQLHDTQKQVEKTLKVRNSNPLCSPPCAATHEDLYSRRRQSK